MSESFTFAEFGALRKLLQESCGLYFDDDKYSRVSGIVTSRMAELGVTSFSEYRRKLVSGSGGKAELVHLAGRLTVGETHFFRNKNHWHVLGECILPWIVGQHASDGQRRIRIWSAGCSTGEEAYTASMVIHENLPDAANWDIEILGTDIDPAAIAKARRAVYTANSFRGVSHKIIKKHFDIVENNQYHLHDEICRTVRFKEMNLLDQAAMARMHDFDVVFCRNVLIYFDSESIQQVLADFYRSLQPDGYLFLGHSESLHSKVPGFACLHVHDTFLYKTVPFAGGRHEHVSTSRPRERTPEIELRKEAGKVATPVSNRAVENIQPARRTFEVEKAQTKDSNQSYVQNDRELQSTPSSSVKEKHSEPTTDALREQGIEKLLDERHDAAQKIFQQIIEREPNDATSLLYLAMCVTESGVNEPALEMCDRVLQLQPFCAEAYYVKALVYEGVGNYAMALSELDKAVYLDDGFAMAHFRMAGLYDRMGHRDDALRQYANTLKMLQTDDKQRIQLFSGGFSVMAIVQTCERRLGIIAAAR